MQLWTAGRCDTVICLCPHLRLTINSASPTDHEIIYGGVCVLIADALQPVLGALTYRTHTKDELLTDLVGSASYLQKVHIAAAVCAAGPEYCFGKY